jgi:hypothetical protein
MSSGAYAAVTIAEKNSVVSSSIKNGQVKSRDVAKNAVNSKKIKDGQVTSADIGDGQVTSADIGDGQIGVGDLSPTALGNYCTKAQSDAQYAPYPKTIRGTYILHDIAVAAGAATFTDISFGVTLSAAPTPVLMQLGGPANANCTGTAAAPQAAPGFLCLYESAEANYTAPTFFKSDATPGASAIGTALRIQATAPGVFASIGGWAVTPSGPITTTLAKSKATGPATALLP